MEIQLLPAEYGDAIVIKTIVQGKTFTIVVDGGPESTEDKISRQLHALGHIDLMVLTHFDEDHIMGLIKYVELFQGAVLPVDEFWCNCAQKIDLSGEVEIAEARYEHANTLAGFLREQKKKETEFRWTEDITVSLKTYSKGDLKIDVLSPTEDVLKVLRKGYDEYFA
mgnify:CR=1 FL=1